MPDAVAFAAWGFSAFDDAAPLVAGGAKLDAAMVPSLGPDLPNAPALVRAEDGTGGVWMLDSGVRRAVDPARWRLSANDVAAMNPRWS